MRKRIFTSCDFLHSLRSCKKHNMSKIITFYIWYTRIQNQRRAAPSNFRLSDAENCANRSSNLELQTVKPLVVLLIPKLACPTSPGGQRFTQISFRVVYYVICYIRIYYVKPRAFLPVDLNK